MSDIKPRIVDGEPVCNSECSHLISPAFEWLCEISSERIDIEDCLNTCIPALRQQRDQAIAERDVLRKEVFGHIHGDNGIYDRPDLCQHRKTYAEYSKERGWK